MTTLDHPAPSLTDLPVAPSHHLRQLDPANRLARVAPIRLFPNRALRVYLAGPDVFERESGRTFSRLSQMAHAMGLSPIVPMEGWGSVEKEPAGPDAAERQGLAQRIFAANIARLDSADGVLANLRDFRGSEPDSGTVFEVGYAFARGIPVVGYGVPQACYSSRVGLRQACERDDLGVLRESANGCQVEDFGQRLNLMLACAVGIEVDAQAAMVRLATHLRE